MRTPLPKFSDVRLRRCCRLVMPVPLVLLSRKESSSSRGSFWPMSSSTLAGSTQQSIERSRRDLSSASSEMSRAHSSDQQFWMCTPLVLRESQRRSLGFICLPLTLDSVEPITEFMQYKILVSAGDHYHGVFFAEAGWSMSIAPPLRATASPPGYDT